jgi:hypothetical protein
LTEPESEPGLVMMIWINFSIISACIQITEMSYREPAASENYDGLCRAEAKAEGCVLYM